MQRFVEAESSYPGEGYNPLDKASIQCSYRLNHFYKTRFEFLAKTILRSSAQAEFEKMIIKLVDENADKIDLTYDSLNNSSSARELT